MPQRFRSHLPITAFGTFYFKHRARARITCLNQIYLHPNTKNVDKNHKSICTDHFQNVDKKSQEQLREPKPQTVKSRWRRMAVTKRAYANPNQPSNSYGNTSHRAVCVSVCLWHIWDPGNRVQPVRVQSATAIYLASFRFAITI